MNGALHFRIVILNLAAPARVGLIKSVRNFVIQLHPGEYHDFVRYLKALEFEGVVLDTPPRRFKTWGQLLIQYACGMWQLAKRRRELRGARTLVVFSHFAFAVKFLARCHILKYERLLCFGFFLHRPGWFFVFRWLTLLDHAQDHYIVFSEAERDLYHSRLQIEKKRIHFVPLGDWRQTRIDGCKENQQATTGDYYFAGGRSNREYVGLVEAFRSLPAKLVIACSQTNWDELKNLELPGNVMVVRDIPANAFDEYMRSTKAGIIALQHDTGSSGQSVALAMMRSAKCILATRTGGLQEYIEDGVSGFWIDDLATDLPRLIRELENDPERLLRMGDAARRRYERHFSLATAAAAFENVLAAVSCNEEATHSPVEMAS